MLGRGRSARGTNMGTLLKDRKWKDGIREIPTLSIGLLSKFQALVHCIKSLASTSGDGAHNTD